MKSWWKQWLRGRNTQSNSAPRVKLGVQALEGRMLLSTALPHAVPHHAVTHAIVSARPEHHSEVLHDQQSDSPDAKDQSGSIDKGMSKDKSPEQLSRSARPEHHSEVLHDQQSDSPDAKDQSGSIDKGTSKDKSPEQQSLTDQSQDKQNDHGTDTSSDSGSGSSSDSPDQTEIIDLAFASWKN